MLLAKATIKFIVEGATENEEDRIAEAIEDEIEMGLNAVGENIVSKYGGGKLTFKVEL